MITGIIAAVVLIAVLPPAISNGEGGVILLAIVIAVVLLALGAAGRECDRAYNNRISYWARGGPKERQRTDSTKRGNVNIRINGDVHIGRK